MLLARRGVCIVQKSWLILPNHPIACINMELKIGSGNGSSIKPELSCQMELTASFFILSDLSAEVFGCMGSHHLFIGRKTRNDRMICMDCSQDWGQQRFS